MLGRVGGAVVLVASVLVSGCDGGTASTRDAGSGGADGGGAGGGGQGGQGGQEPDGGAGAGGQGGGTSCVSAFQPCNASTPPCCSGTMCAPGGTCMLIQVSDRNAKRDFAQVNNDEILEGLARLPLSTWSYKSEDFSARHIGPMAQDFMATFHVGATDKAIFQVDGDGVAFAAIQALNERMKRLADENARLRRELSRLRADVSRDRSRAHSPSGRSSQ